ncbi:MAG TPA: C40 family peptidase [Dermatophilaceae bacterium]
MKKWLAAGMTLLVLPVFPVVMTAALLTGTASASACSVVRPAVHPTSSAHTPSIAASAADCPGQGGEGIGGGGLTKLPPGFALPSQAQQQAVVRFALAQLGKPYLWGGTGPNAWDCSGLTMRAWDAVGIRLPRTTFQQVLAGAPVTSTAAMEPGDLIFIAGSDGTPSNPGHVGLYLGLVNAVPFLVHAPQTGKTVEIKPISTWRGLIVAIRRPTGQP